MTQFFPETLPDETAQVVDLLVLTQSQFLRQFYLSGGTGLSLQLGHRQSEDLDFFSRTPFEPERLLEEMKTLGTLSSTEMQTGTLNTFFDGVKLQFLEYPYSLLQPLVYFRELQLSSMLDIACTKLITISMRGSKKDFIDLYFLLEKYTISDLLVQMQKKYQQSDYSLTHILKSLIYFVDAEAQPMPRMLRDVAWDTVKREIVHAVKSVQFE